MCAITLTVVTTPTTVIIIIIIVIFLLWLLFSRAHCASLMQRAAIRADVRARALAYIPQRRRCASAPGRGTDGGPRQDPFVVMYFTGIPVVPVTVTTLPCPALPGRPRFIHRLQCTDIWPCFTAAARRPPRFAAVARPGCAGLSPSPDCCLACWTAVSLSSDAALLLHRCCACSRHVLAGQSFGLPNCGHALWPLCSGAALCLCVHSR